MKKVLFGLSIILLAFSGSNVKAQNILNAEDETNLSNFYTRTMVTTRQAIPYPSLRESDVIWSTVIWRTIDFREKFNQFFYFPKGEDSINNNQGRINLAYLIYRSAANGEFEIFDDDELKIPVDWETMYKKLNKADSTTTDPVYDDYGEMIDEGHDTIKYKSFTSDDYYKIHLKEYWYIDKQDTRMKVRIISLALVDENCKEVDGEMECNPTTRFWIPMNDMRVRNIFARTDAYDIRKVILLISEKDDLFLSCAGISAVIADQCRFRKMHGCLRQFLLVQKTRFRMHVSAFRLVPKILQPGRYIIGIIIHRRCPAR